MAVLRKILQKQDLSSIETYVNDTTFNSKYFNVLSVEDTIPGGKSSFQILGSKFLENDVELKIELIDVNGNPVFIEAIKYLGDKPSRHISIEVYENTPAGVGTLTILGSAEFLSGGDSIPEEWKGLYNIKWERNVYIDPREKNTQPILFQGESAAYSKTDKFPLPVVDISEQIRGIIIPSGSGGTTPTGFVTQSLFTGGNYEANASAFGKPSDVKDASTQDVNGNPFPKPNSPIIPSHTVYGQKPKNQAVDSPIETFTNSDTIYASFHGFGDGLLDSPEEIHPSEPEESVEPNFTGQGTLIKKTSGDPFRAEFEGGIFKAAPSVNLNLVQNIAGRTYTSSSFTASIIAVHSPELVEIDRPFTIQNQKEYPNKNFKVPHKATSFTIDYEPAGQTQNSGSGESTVIFRSFADINIRNLKTFSGDVHRVKTFARGLSEAGDFNLISDRLMETSDVLNDRSSPSLRQKTGVFQTQGHLDKNWKLTRVVKGKDVTSLGSNGTGSLTFTSTSTPGMMNGVIISGSNGMADESIIFESKTSDLRVRPDVDYEIKLRAILKVGEKDVLQSDGTTLQQAKAKVRFYLSGSKIKQNTNGLEDIEGARNSYGDPVRWNIAKDGNKGEVIVLQSRPLDNSVGKLIDFGILRLPFKPNFENDVVVNNDTKLQIEVESGQLYLQRVELLPATETNFSPDEFTFVAPMPKLRTRPEIFDFRLEFYDRNGNKADHSTLTENPITFEGQNEVIQGTDNLLTGSLYIGNTILSGIEAGGANSAYIRSVGYKGFNSSSVSGQGGFAIWSGSVSRSFNTSESYDGVGLEIHDGNSGSFKFRTRNVDGVGEFDVRTDKFFLGKVNQQFVSGSDGNIEISSSGFHLQANGVVTASQMHMDGGTITGSLVIGDSVTVNAATANQIKVPVGGPPFKALILSDGYARFSTGSIASFNINSNALFTTGSNSFYISGSAAGIPTAGGKQNLFISASKFQVSALGDLTASNVLIEGGTITGDVDILGTVSANQIQVPAGGPYKAIISSTGLAKFTTGSIASFHINTDAFFTTGSNSFYISGSASGIPTQGGKQNLFISASKFQVSSLGDITGSNVLFSGGTIAGWDIGSSVISQSVSSDTDGIILNASDKLITIHGAAGKDSYSPGTATNNNVMLALGQIRAGKYGIQGYDTSGNIIFEAGEHQNIIAGWTFTNSTLTGGNVQLSSAGTIKIGSVADATTTATTNSGFFADNSGNVLIKGNVSGNKYIKISGGGGIDIKSDTFDLATTTMVLDSGTNSGKIALGTTPNTAYDGTNAGVYMDGTGKFSVYGDASNYIRFSGATVDIKSDEITIQTAGTNKLKLFADGTNTPTFAMGATLNTAYDGTNAGVYMDGTGKFSVYGDASNYIRFSGGTVDIKSDEITIQTAGTNKLKLFADGANTPTFAMGATLNTSVDGTNQGIYMDGTGDFLVRGDASNFLKIDGTTFTIKSEIFALDTTNLDIDSATKRITINDGSADRIHIGEVDGGTTYGMKIYDGTGTADSDILVEFGEGQNYIAGWTIGTDTISSNNLVLHSSGKIETSNFVSGVKGWRIDSLQNGTAEFENARIRGTLSTTVFEKETINAVGGQLYVANSSVITSSVAHSQGTVSASNATMSLVNVTGFTGSYEGGPGHSGLGKGEILAIKKVTDTGFSTEYVQVVSASRLNPSSGTDLSGLLFVTRSYGGGIDETGTGLSSSLGDPAFLTAQQYEPGQVVVSTGRYISGTGDSTVGSGFVRINANPNDLSTPYVDIVERTGSAIYDVDLKARLGDLSGLSSALVGTSPGFGLFTDSAFLTNDVTVGTLGLEHIVIDSTSIKFKDSTTVMAELRGTTWTLGGAHGATDDAIVLSPTNGVKIYDSSTDYVTITSDGLKIFESGAQVAVFAATTIIGSADDKITLSSSGITIREAATDVISLVGGDMTLTGGTITIQSDAAGGGNDDRMVIGAGSLAMFANDAKVLDIEDASINIGPAANAGAAVIGNIRLGTGGAFIYGAATDDYVNVKSDGVDVVAAGVTQAAFGATTTIGNTSGDYIEIDSTSIDMFRNQTSVIKMVDGTITVAPDTSAATTDAVVIAAGGVKIYDNSADYIHITADGLDVYEGSTKRARIGSTITLAPDVSAATTDSVVIASGGVKIYDNTYDYLHMSSTGLDVYTNISSAAVKIAQFGEISVIGSGTVVSDSSTDDCIRIQAGSVTMFQDSNQYATLQTTGLTVVHGGIPVGEFGAGIQLKSGTQTSNTASLDAQGLTIVKGGVTASVFGSSVELRSGVITSKTTASLDANGLTIVQNALTSSHFGSTVQLGKSGEGRVEISDTAIGMYSGESTPRKRVAIDSSGKIAIGGTSAADVSVTSTDDVVRITPGGGVRIYEDSNNYSVVDASGVTINQGGSQVAQFASTSVIGSSTDKVTISDSGIIIRENNINTIQLASGAVIVGEVGASKSNVQITSGAINLRNNTTNKMILGADGSISIGSNFAVTSAGVVTLTGSITISNPEDQGFTKTFRQDDAPTAITVGDLWYDTNDGNKLYRASATGASNWVATVDGTIATAQTQANTATTNAATAQTQANTATTNAATAQSAIDTMETQLVLDSGGMGLWSSGGVSSGFLIADYGTTTKFYDGVDDLAANVKLQLNASGIKLYGADLTDYLSITSGDVSMYTNSVRNVNIVDGKISIGPAANAGATLGAVIGNIHLASTGAYIYGDTTNTFAAVTAAGLELTEDGNKKAIFGAISVIGSDGAAVTTTSTDDCIRIADGTITMFTDSSNKAVVNSSGLAVTQGGVDVASFGSTVRVGPDANSKSRVEISSGAVNIINKDGSGNETTVISFDSSGDITSDDFLIERTRLFGAGNDGDVILKSNTAVVTNGAGSADEDGTDSVLDENGTEVCSRNSATWTMQGDWYCASLEVDASVAATTLCTNGYRLFVQGTLTIDPGCVIHNDGSAGSTGEAGGADVASDAGQGGDGGGESGCSLTPGTAGVVGATGGTPDTGGVNYGGQGGGSGGAGGIIFIAARAITNNGTIRSAGGAGGVGGVGTNNGVTEPLAGGAGSAGSAGSVIHIKI